MPLKIVGSNVFGRYPKVSVEETFNMLISDNALVPTAGYKNQKTLTVGAKGRMLYSSARQDIMVAVIGEAVYRIDSTVNTVLLGTISSNSGNVYISENNHNQIVITDGVEMYIYNYVTASTGPLVLIPLDFAPGHISFQNQRFIVAATDSTTGVTSWRLSVLTPIVDANSWPATAQFVGALQSKPDKVQAAVPFPGRGNILFLFGETVAEQWTNIASSALFPYQRSSNFNVDFGCLNPATIASLDMFVVWLAGNEQSGATIMYSTGGQAQKISNDGIDFKLANLTAPQDSFGFLFQQDGHVIYQITFYTDNLSYIYDFNTQKFFTVTDEDLNYHIARQVVFFKNKYWFVSAKDGGLYEFGTQYTNYEYSSDYVKEIPRIRTCPPFRIQNQTYFIMRSLGFTIENGQYNSYTTVSYDIDGNELILATENDNEITTENNVLLITEQDNTPTDNVTYVISNMAVDLKVSIDGGVNFGTSYRIDLNRAGKRRSRLVWYRIGQSNDMTPQFQFWGFGRFVAFDGVAEVYQ